MSTSFAAAALFAALLVLCPTPSSAGAARLIVRYDASASSTDRVTVRSLVGADVVRNGTVPGTQVLAVDDALAPTALRLLRASADVSAVEVDQPVRTSAVPVPDDPAFGDEWALSNTGQSVQGRAGVSGQDVRALVAWERSRGAGVTVAVLDTGTDLGIADLATNAWTNTGEVAGNGVDDDGDGRVDDVYGWNFVGDDGNVADDQGHGTHVAGTIGAAAGNGLGIAGVAPRSRLMTVKVLDRNGSGYVSDVADGFEYAARMGARVVNASLGGAASSEYLRSALARHPDVTLVTAAGNEAADVDATPSYPCAYDLPNVVCVGAGTNTGLLAATFSNVGATSVDLVAPGRDVRSYAPGGGLVYMSGTSMAAPHVSGAAALAYALVPSLTPSELRAALIASARPVPSLVGKVVAGGTLDAAALLQEVAPVAVPPAQDAPAPEVPSVPADAVPAAPPVPSAPPARAVPGADATPPAAPLIDAVLVPRRTAAVVVDPSTLPPTTASDGVVALPSGVPLTVRTVRRRPPRQVRVTGTGGGPLQVRACASGRCASVLVTPRRGAWTATVRLPVSTRLAPIRVRATALPPR